MWDSSSYLDWSCLQSNHFTTGSCGFMSYFVEFPFTGQNYMRDIPFEILRGGGGENFVDPSPHIFAFFSPSPSHIFNLIFWGPPTYMFYFCRGPLPTNFHFWFPLCPLQDLKWNISNARWDNFCTILVPPLLSVQCIFKQTCKITF